MRRLLVVDDEPEDQETLLGLLGAEDRHIDVATSLVDALSALQTSQYDLVVADIRLVRDDPSNTDGLELLRRIKADNAPGSPEVIIVTNYPGMTEDDQTVGVAALLYGATAYVNRALPFFAKWLPEQVEVVLGLAEAKRRRQQHPG